MSTPHRTSHRRKLSRVACRLCRRFKTRCELPDPDVRGGPNPLSPDKRCHRCSVLKQACIVDIKSKNVASHGPEAQSTRAGTAIPLGDQRITNDTNPSGVASVERLEDLSIFNKWSMINASSPLSRISIPSPTQSDELEKLPVPTSSPTYDYPPELALAMLRHAYGPCYGNDIHSGGNLVKIMSSIVDATNSNGTPSRFDSLLMFHPHLPSVSDINPDSLGGSLLLATINHLCDPCETSATNLSVLRDLFLLRLNPSLDGAMALELLAVHAPLGILPGQCTHGAHINLYRSIPMALKNLSQSKMKKAEWLMTGPISIAFASAGMWSAFAVCEVESSRSNATYQALAPPDTLRPAAALCDQFLNDPQLWQGNQHRLLGKLYVCERLLMLSIEAESISKLRQLLVQQLFFGTSQSVSDDVDAISQQAMSSLTRTTAKVDRLARKIVQSDVTPPGWTLYRKLLDYTTRGCIHRAILRFFFATSALGEIRGMGLLNMEEAVDEAFMLARQPAQITLFFSQHDEFNKMLQERCARVYYERVNTLEQTIVVFLNMPPLQSKEILPWHMSSAVCLVAAKVIYQIENGDLLMSPALKEVRTRFIRPEQWDYLVTQAARHLGTLEGNVCQSLTAAFGSLLDSLVRLAKRDRSPSFDDPTVDETPSCSSSTGTSIPSNAESQWPFWRPPVAERVEPVLAATSASVVHSEVALQKPGNAGGYLDFLLQDPGYQW